MSLLPLGSSLSQHVAADLGQCGPPFNYLLTSMSETEAVTQACERMLTAAALGEGLQLMRCVVDGADPNFEEPSSGETALHRAAQRNHPSVVEVLASLGADMDKPDRAGRTPLYFAASGGRSDLVHKLLSHGASLFPLDFNTPSKANINVASISSASQQSGSFNTNLNGPSRAFAAAPAAGNGADADDDATFLSLRTICPLAAAAAAGNWPIVAALLTALPADYQQCPAALRSLRFLIWALACHRAFPRDVIARLPPCLPRCVVDAVRPAHLASTPLVLATGNDQQQLMQWLLQQGADPELGAPILLCAGRFCRGARTCCVSTLLRRGARPHVAWADNPNDSPLWLAASGDCFTHVHCLIAYGADVDGEAARVRQTLYAAAPWEAHLDRLMKQYGELAATPRADILCPCGQQHARWSGLWPQDAEGEDAEGERQAVAAEAGSVGNSCHYRTPADDAWYRRHCEQMELLQDGNELAECRKVVDELWRYGCSAVVSELGGTPSAPHSLIPQRILAAMQDVAGGWLVAAARCRHQRELRIDLYDKAVAAGRALLDQKRIAALAALGGVHGRSDGSGGGGATAAAVSDSHGMADLLRAPQNEHLQRSFRQPEGLMKELKMEILALAGLAPVGIEPNALGIPARAPCCCMGCRK
ncbi:hypothetical protein Vretimale_5086 [Volvox reticuliferus]|uniref:Uncharacterized protein n=1 Tax=Volvox reticuliferus TaxID=1737510 RepID=A0A8J4DGQ4_9CHLO|nr:hypothetical protein Vretifemale_3966 [Volvox reticuliferus]GIM00017.1 hypothetical protein Vretimale_5086 [Volvox reticuliferus]